MFRRIRRGPEPQNKTVWLLGRYNRGADKSVVWDSPFPDFADPDVLIVDMTTMDEGVLERTATKLDRAHKSIRDMFLGGGTVVVLTWPYTSVHPKIISPTGMQSPYRYSNYHILPAELSTVPQEGTGIEASEKNTFAEYIESVKSFSFYIGGYESRIVADLPPNIKGAGLAPLADQGIHDNSGHDLGLTLVLTCRDGRGRDKPHPGAGRLVFLPPPADQTGDAIDKILAVYGKAPDRAEPPPEWAGNLRLKPADECRAQIAKLHSEKARAQGDIDGLERRLDEVLAHRRLLYSKGAELEDAVVKAFKIIGFDDIKLMAGADEEDAAFAMGGATPYSHGVVEVKGVDKRIQIQHILQCNRWTDQRAVADGGPAKGIFVPNQHRLKDYHKSLKDRVKVEPNQLEQAEMKDICIIPSCVLFEAVGRVLGGEAPDRAKTTAKIADCRGVLTDVL